MYQQFGFQNRPFGSIATAASYFPASAAEAALEAIRVCVERAAGPALLIGAAGLGKSQILAVLQHEFRQTFRVVQVQACSRMSRRHDLLQNILFELGQPYRQLSEGELRLALIDYLRPTPHCPNGILLLVDDGQTLSGRLLDELRLIHNFVRDGQPRVRLVIAGTQELEERLTHPQLESLQQRIAVRGYLTPFRRDEIAAYLQHQLQRAGGPGTSLFQPSAIQAVAQLCEGNPRLMNQVCDHALMLAESSGSPAVAGDLIAEAYSDIQQLPIPSWSSSRRMSGVTGESDGSRFVEANEERAATPASASAESPSWTVIEFGELSDPAVPRALADAPGDSPQHPAAITTLHGAPIPSSAQVAIRPLTHNPLAESFERELAVPNEAKLVSTSRGGLNPPGVDTKRQRLDPSADPLGAGHFAPLPAASSASSPTIVVQTSLGSAPSSTDAAFEAVADGSPHPAGAATSPQAAAAGRSDRPSPPSDDRDMIVIGTLPENSSLPSVAPDESESEGTQVSRGRVVRVEYNELFLRLRSGAP